MNSTKKIFCTKEPDKFANQIYVSSMDYLFTNNIYTDLTHKINCYIVRKACKKFKQNQRYSPMRKHSSFFAKDLLYNIGEYKKKFAN